MFLRSLACKKAQTIGFSCVLLAVGATAAAEDAKLEGFVFETPVECVQQGGEDCTVVSFQIHGAAAAMIFEGMKSEISKERDICTDLHYKRDEKSGLICYQADGGADGLCTFGYDFSMQNIREWAGSC